MEPKHPDVQDKKYLDINLSDFVAYAVGFCAPPIFIYQTAKLPNAVFVFVWGAMVIASFLILKLKNKSRFIKALAQGVLASCVVNFVLLVALVLVMRQIMPALCC